jgi:precorrin-4/cobalt-precorrin-4 C11-methyltransferase
MSSHKVYFIGAGPGDPGLLTLKGAHALAQCHTVFAPTPYEETFGERVQGKEILVPFDYYFEELLDMIQVRLQEGPVAFLVPGDLTFYSPFQGLVDALADRAEIIAGVGTANAVSARLKKTLNLPQVCHNTVILSPRTLGEGPDAPRIRDFARPGTTLIIYMNTLPLADLIDELRCGFGCNVPMALIHRLYLPGEEMVLGSLDDMVERVGERDFFGHQAQSRKPALTLVLVGESLVAREDGQWWNRRRDKIWRPSDTP